MKQLDLVNELINFEKGYQENGKVNPDLVLFEQIRYCIDCEIHALN